MRGRSKDLRLDGTYLFRNAGGLGGYGTQLGGYRAIAASLGISQQEAYWLFGARDQHECFPARSDNPRKHNSRKHVLARLRKFLYYKMRKSELLGDYETARHREGDWGFLPQAELAVA